ncbi:hypothetical protein G3A_13660 [Bacillus sp. 17376]|uniref:DUF485 domain-containing protein n=1 Tax=Mesobacillus boroniphilus JCM 21738 TaxID=1294265 RepID=W4RN71_9BACI|nr:hypothetical protein [Mesobacillus boroniphilus]ESU31949.1 hypothetical protein G3A_13660 [Bacillus sp. 17376]GAE45572.1 hypothetical protein JCM21738_2391 [Mesobacillus boroniphilus JCM 21738]
MAGEYREYNYVAADTIDVSELEPLDPETKQIMKSEFSTGIKLTLFYYVFILSIPILNWYAGEFMFSRMWGGMTYSWFFTSIVAMAMAFVIALIHTTLYEKRLKKSGAEQSSSPADGRRIG